MVDADYKFIQYYSLPPSQVLMVRSSGTVISEGILSWAPFAPLADGVFPIRTWLIKTFFGHQ